MQVFIATALCKCLYFVGGLVGKGSSLPGQVALKLFPNVLGNLKLPNHIIAVTGSNGKTSTSELISHALESNGLSVSRNHEGSNQTEGAATLLLRISSLNGTINCDAVILECDERYAKQIFSLVKPTSIVVTNLCRDQLTRNGHPEFVLDCIQAAVDTACNDATLVLNADDPYVSALTFDSDSDAKEEPHKIVWFGIGSNAVSGNSISVSKYDDGAFCPCCKERMTYSYRVTAHFGDFRCSSCGFVRKNPNFEVSDINFSSGMVKIIDNSTDTACNHPDSTSGNKSDDKRGGTSETESRLATSSLVGAYNLTAAISAAYTTGVAPSKAAAALNNYELTGGRTVRFDIGGRDGILLIAKHENSLAYNQSLSWVISQKTHCTVVIVVNSISRKYYTSETSWLWDIDFDVLGDRMVLNIVLAGHYVSELATRFAMTSIDSSKISYAEDLSELREHIDKNTSGDIYTLTCFSDKAKFLQSIETRG